MRRIFLPIILVLITVALHTSCQGGAPFNTKKKDEFKVTPSGSKAPETPSRTFDSTLEYALFCKKELGLADEPLKPWNCLEGKEIPITIAGKPLDVENYPKLSQGQIGCDRPSWLIPSESCMNYAFVLERDLAPDVKGVIICRNRKFTSPLDKKARRQQMDLEKTVESLIKYYEIDTVGLIWTHMKSGKTCFFDYRGPYGGYIPSPDDIKKPQYEDLPEPKFPKDAKGKTFSDIHWSHPESGWQPPQFVASTDVCIRCHDSGPFLGSPWLAQVYSPPKPAKEVPYLIVGDLFAATPELMPPTALSTAQVTSPTNSGEDQNCTACHRLGKHYSCSHMIPYSLGLKSPLELQEATPPPTPVWMPPVGGTFHTDKVQWEKLYAHHVRHLQCCCQNPSALNCVSFDLSKDPLRPIPGAGPGQCP